jgi:hypothetical protein
MKFSQVVISAIALSLLPLASAPGPAARTLPHAPTAKITAPARGLNRVPVRPRNVEGFRPRGRYWHYYTGEPYRHSFTGEPYWFYYTGQPYYLEEFGAEYAPLISPAFGETIGGATDARGGGWTTVTQGAGAIGYQYYPSGGVTTLR